MARRKTKINIRLKYPTIRPADPSFDGGLLTSDTPPPWAGLDRLLGGHSFACPFGSANPQLADSALSVSLKKLAMDPLIRSAVKSRFIIISFLRKVLVSNQRLKIRTPACRLNLVQPAQCAPLVPFAFGKFHHFAAAIA